MQLETLSDKLRAYVYSVFYPITLATIAFVTWILPGNFQWISIGFYFILSFLPLFGKDGKCYMPLLLFPIIMTNQDIAFDTMPYSTSFAFAGVILSMILFLIIHKPKFERSNLFYCLISLFAIFFISYLYNSIKSGFTGSYGILYLLTFALIAVLYLILHSVLGKKESFPYFCKTVALFSFIIDAEILWRSLLHGFAIQPENFTLGWSYTVQTASTLLCLSLPFIGILISKKRYLWSFVAIADFAGIIMLSADSGLLSLMVFFIPVILLSLRKTGKNYPYYSLGAIVVMGSSFAILMGTNQTFNERVLIAIQSLNIFHEADTNKAQLFSTAMDQFKANPVLGLSINAMIQENGQILLNSNTTLSTMTLGGSFGLLAFFIYEINLYIQCFRKATEDKWLFFIFLLALELIGLMDNTIYNLGILLFSIIAISCYQMSNRPDDILVHEDYYSCYRQEDIDALR